MIVKRMQNMSRLQNRTESVGKLWEYARERIKSRMSGNEKKN